MGKKWSKEEAKLIMEVMICKGPDTSWEEVAQQVVLMGVLDSEGNPYTPERIEEIYTKYEEEEMPPKKQKGNGAGSLTLEMGRRYNQLRAGGMAGKEAAEQVNQEFKTSLSFGAIRFHGHKAKKATVTTQGGAARHEEEHKEVLHKSHDVIQPDTGEEPKPEPETPSVIQSETVIQEKREFVAPCKTVTQVTPEMVADLQEMLNWWKTREDELMPSIEPAGERPEFKRDSTITKTIRIAKGLYDDAERFSRQHKNVTGGSFSGLVEVLIWERLGKPERHVVKTEQAKGEEYPDK